MKPRRPSKLAIAFLMVFAAVVAHRLFFRAPSEAEMITKFHQNKAEFEQIRLMMAEDKNLQSISGAWAEAKDKVEKDGTIRQKLPLNIPEARLALYRSSLKKLGFDTVFSRRGIIQFPEFGGGFTDTTWSIGYAWSGKPLSPLVKSAYSKMPGQNKVHYSRIEGNWYLYHRR